MSEWVVFRLCSFFLAVVGPVDPAVGRQAEKFSVDPAGVAQHLCRPPGPPFGLVSRPRHAPTEDTPPSWELHI
ncbi:hypothetical protein EYF80_043202 [Liparis tanakae]|uniref:Secreted protein n=1 Tax=Liparis tanakae TaxID=230148 RepID=A0A4Z2G0I0_9TELE|nr:hypothetical protein EYF80_043202 [Liparis tanakae]